MDCVPRGLPPKADEGARRHLRASAWSVICLRRMVAWGARSGFLEARLPQSRALHAVPVPSGDRALERPCCRASPAAPS